MSLWSCLYGLFRIILAVYLAHRFISWNLKGLRAYAERRLWRKAVCRAAEQMVLIENCQDLRSYGPTSLFLSSRDFIEAFYRHLKCPIMALEIFTTVLKNLHRAGVLWRPSTKLKDCFDVGMLYKCSTLSMRLLAAKKLLKVLKRDLNK